MKGVKMKDLLFMDFVRILEVFVIGGFLIYVGWQCAEVMYWIKIYSKNWAINKKGGI